MKYLHRYNNQSEYDNSYKEDVDISFINSNESVIFYNSNSGSSGEGEDETESEISYVDKYLTFVIVSGNTIGIKTNGSIESKTISYSINNGIWNTIISSSTTDDIVYISGLTVGDKIRFKGLNTQYATSDSNFISFTGGDATYAIYGNILSLLFGDEFDNVNTLPNNNYCLCGLFANNTNLLSIKNLILPAITLSGYCYKKMFYGCNKIKISPKLPALTLTTHCYESMFEGCSSLMFCPDLLATTLNYSCYSCMFKNCSSLLTMSNLPATTIKDCCYEYMFYNCSSLNSTISTLPANTLQWGCYQYMFAGCSKIQTGPSLPALQLAEYCYQYMFENCILLSSCPSLPASTLKNYCYCGMFSGCTSITSAPNLLASDISHPSNYMKMFYHCSSLRYIKCLATSRTSQPICPNWVTGVAAYGTFCKNKNTYWWTTDNNGIPSGWSVSNV